MAAAAEVAHLLAAASGAPAAASKLQGGVGRLCSVPEEVLREEGACQALALAVRVLVPRGASPLGVAEVEPFLSPLFLDNVRHDSHDVREVGVGAFACYLVRNCMRNVLCIPQR